MFNNDESDKEIDLNNLYSSSGRSGIQSIVDKMHWDISHQSWVGSLIFDVISDSGRRRIDILKDHNAKELDHIHDYWFPPTTYPIDNGYDGDGFKQLSKDLVRAARQ